MKPGFIDTVHAVTCLLMWLKLLYFLRLFESTSHLIRVIFNMVWEMKIFIGVLFVVCMAFGEAFLRLSEKGDVPEGDKPMLANFADAFVFTIRLTVGDTDISDIYDVSQPVTGFILFVIFEVLTCILLLSLLVTLIMKQYDKISKDVELSNYQQKAKLVYENSYLTQIFRSCRCCTNFELERNLMIITDLTNEGMHGLGQDTRGKDAMTVMQENVQRLVRENGELREIINRQNERTNKKIDIIAQHIKKVGA